nr:hypothetical protein [Dickeya solani]
MSDAVAEFWKRFADIMMSRGLAELKAVFSHALDASHYTQQLPRLQRGVHAFLLLGVPIRRGYPRYLQLWRELMQLIEALSAARAYPASWSTAAAGDRTPPFWLHSAIISAFALRGYRLSGTASDNPVQHLSKQHLSKLPDGQLCKDIAMTCHPASLFRSLHH